MQAQDVIGRVRTLLVDANINGRYSETELLSLLNDAQNALNSETKWLKSTLYGATVGGTQEYQLPEIERIDRVYVAGQPIIPTTIPLLQGDQIGFWDQSAVGYQTQWQTAPQSDYPVSSPIGGYTTTGVPYYAGQRPQWYMRGANIGFVPVPIGAYPIALDVVAIPPIIANDTDYLVFPSQAKDALAYWVVIQEMFANEKPEQMQLADGLYNAALKKLRATLEGMNQEVTRAPIMRPYRGQFRGRYRNPGTLGGWQ